MQLAKAMEDARKAKERGRELHLKGVLESDVHLLFDDRDFTGSNKAGMFNSLFSDRVLSLSRMAGVFCWLHNDRVFM